MRVDESWRPNGSESCNSHQLSSSFDRALSTLFISISYKYNFSLGGGYGDGTDIRKLAYFESAINPEYTSGKVSIHVQGKELLQGQFLKRKQCLFLCSNSV